MEITTTYPKPATLSKPVSPEQKKVATSDGGGDKGGSVAEDSVQLSEASLKRAQATSEQGGVRMKAIENAEQAFKAVGQAVSSLRNNPGMGQQAYGNLSQVNFKLLLG